MRRQEFEISTDWCWVIYKMSCVERLQHQKVLELKEKIFRMEKKCFHFISRFWAANGSVLPLFILLNVFVSSAFAQNELLQKNQLQAVGVTMSLQKIDGKEVVRVVKDSTVKGVDESTFVRIAGSNFKNGTIEVNVLSKLRPDATADARGFIGLAFRINDTNSKFECIYIRPTNGRADDQVRRNHSIQYFSYPDFKFFRLRKEFPEQYESYADMGLNEWIKMKIVVNGAKAKLYINDNNEPSLIVNDLKLGPDESGAIGLFVDIGTEGYFADLKISK